MFVVSMQRQTPAGTGVRMTTFLRADNRNLPVKCVWAGTNAISLPRSGTVLSIAAACVYSFGHA
jgi:hypothetical protein